MSASLRWRWRTFPLPEAHLVLLLGGLLLHGVCPRRIPATDNKLRATGAVLVIAGLALAAWATAEAGDNDLEKPDRLLMRGPYAMSRHPMYVGWTLIYLGVSLIVGSVWLFFLLPALLALVRVQTLREERRVIARFGADYQAYRRRVRRYL